MPSYLPAITIGTQVAATLSTTTRSVVLLLIAFLWTSTAGAMSFPWSPQWPPQPVTRTAHSAGTPAPFPHLASYGFEDPGIDDVNVTHHIYGQATPPANSWLQWSFGGTSGIAWTSSPLTPFNPPTPDGKRIAFLEGMSVVATSHVFPVGTYRLRLRGAQRKQPSSIDAQRISVSVAGVELAQFAFATETYEEYSTRPIRFDASSLEAVVISGLVTGHMAMIDEIRLEPISEWNQASTWNVGTPGGADPVIIPTGVAVAITALGAQAGSITVYGELLVANRDATLSADDVMISGTGARLEIGRLESPYAQDFTLELKGPPIGSNTRFLMAANGGTIDLHGLEKTAWTRLNMTAQANDSTIDVLDLDGWEVGDQVVVTGSTHQRSTPSSSPLPRTHPNYLDFSERRHIIAINPTLKRLTLDAPLLHRHHGSMPSAYSSPPTPAYPAGQTWTLDQRAEVGMLTHNIKIQGRQGPGEAGLGGHIMIMGPNPPVPAGAAYLSNVELYHMGQKDILGRYPMHWHLVQDAADGQYMRNCSVHESFNRAITIHGTDSVQVERNVCYRNVGHAVFLEDGGEENNTIRENLVINTLRPLPGEEVLPSDNELEELQNRTPASFWISNPNNTIVGNVAAGTEGTGFWLIFSDAVHGASAGLPFFNGRFPRSRNLGVFADNTCHSSGSGFDINDAVHPVTGSIIANVAWTPTIPPEITGLTIYGCDMGLYAGISSEHIVFRDCKFADNNENIRLAAYHTVTSSLIAARTGNVNWPSGSGPNLGFVVYDGAARLSDCHVVGFQFPTDYFIWGAGAATLHPNALFSGMTYSSPLLPRIYFGDFESSVNPSGLPVNTNYADPQNLANGRKYGMALRDLDGSLWGVPGSSVIGNHPIMHVPSADLTPATPPSPNVRVTTLRFGHFRLAYPNVPSHLFPQHTLRREPNGSYGDPGTIEILDPFTFGLFKQTALVVSGGFSYTLRWTPSLPANRAVDVTLDDVELADSVLVTMESLGSQPNLTIQGATQVSTLVALNAATTTSFLVSGGQVILRFVGVQKRIDLQVRW